MAYERAHPVTLQLPTWLRWTGGLLALMTGTVVGAVSGNIGGGIFIAVVMYGVQRTFAGGGFGSTTPSKLRVEAGKLAMNELPIITPKQRLALPQTITEGDSKRLRLRSRLRIVDIGIAHDDEARTILEAIGLDTANQVSAFVWQTPLPNWTELGFLLAIPVLAVLVASLYAPGAIVPIIVASSVLTLVAATLRFYFAEVEITVGVDGIVLRQGFRPLRFIRHQRIEAVRVDKVELTIELAGGERIRVSATIQAEPTESDLAHATAIAERIEKARTAAAEFPAAPAETPGLLRGNRTAKEWLEALRKLGEGGESAFRDATPPRDQLWQIIESMDAPAVERIAAAVALTASGLSSEEAPRLRIAAEGAVEPKLGDRLRVVSENDVKEDALAEVLEEAQREEG